jgi:hypothetical protein
MSVLCHTFIRPSAIAPADIAPGNRPISSNSGSKMGSSLNWIFALSAIALLCCLSLSAVAQVPHSSHVVLVVEENTSYSTAVANMPWLVSQGNTYAHADNYTTNSGGSLLDYLWLSSGSCHANATDCSPSTLPAGTNDFGCNGEACGGTTAIPGVITDNNIYRVLDGSGLSWKMYAESIPSTGYTGDGPYPYVRRP